MQEPPTAWTDWVTYHATLFGLDSDRDLATLLVWRDLFEAAGYDPRELRAASDSIALAPEPPRWRIDHLDRLQSAVRAARREAQAAERAAAGEVSWPDCHNCAGTGFAIVPHLRHVLAGVWAPDGQTFAVSCDCRAGQREQREKLITLRRYEALNQHWRDQLAERKQRDLERARARDQTSAADRLLGPIVRRLLAGVKGGKA